MTNRKINNITKGLKGKREKKSNVLRDKIKKGQTKTL